MVFNSHQSVCDLFKAIDANGDFLIEEVEFIKFDQWLHRLFCTDINRKFPLSKLKKYRYRGRILVLNSLDTDDDRHLSSSG